MSLGDFDEALVGLPLVTNDHKDFTWITSHPENYPSTYDYYTNYNIWAININNFDPSPVKTEEDYPNGYHDGYSASTLSKLSFTIINLPNLVFSKISGENFLFKKHKTFCHKMI